MNCSTLPPSAQEDRITEDMLDLLTADTESEMASDVFAVGATSGGRSRGLQSGTATSTSFSLRNGAVGGFALGTMRHGEIPRTEMESIGSLMGLDSMESIVLQRQSRRGSLRQRAVVSDDAQSEITSDDSGDFAFLTADVRDAADYDAIRDYMVYCKQQERDLEELEEECARLEAEQQALYGTAVAAKLTRRGSVAPPTGDGPLSPDASAAHSHAGATASGSGGGPLWTAAEAVAAEFGEEGVDPLQPCPYTEAQGGGPKARLRYRYTDPAVPGDYSPVFKTGFLYRCVTPEGLWVFYNDSQKYRMEVRYIFGASSTVAAGPHATLRRLPSGESEVVVTVWPQETEVLLEGEVNGFKNLSVATPVDASYANPHTAASTAEARAVLARCAAQLGRAAPPAGAPLLTTEEVLAFCYAEGDAHFVDPAFPPCTASLYRHGVDDMFLWDMPWRRPASYLPAKQAAEACLFVQAALPTDPSCGEGGDAYLCSAASLLAETPAAVYRLFRHPTSPSAGLRERAAGAYAVTVGHGGWWTQTVVDSYLPASRRGPDMGRSPHDLRKLWYPLLEKAYAKLHGSYAAVQCGDPLEALQDFTGFPTFRFDDEWAEVVADGRSSVASFARRPEEERLFAMLEEKVERCRYLVCLSLPDEGPAEGKAVLMGLVYGMSYAVLRVVRHGDYRLLQIRCPTMRLDGDGLWCAESVRWRQEPELAALCGMTPRASSPRSDAGGESEVGAEGQAGLGVEEVSTPGGLWLDWSEALLMFEGGGVCCVHWDWTEDCRVRGTFHNGVPSLALEVRVDPDVEDGDGSIGGGGDGGSSEPVEAYCILSQEDDRGLPPDHPNRVLQPLLLCQSSRAEASDKMSSSSSPSSMQCVRLACSTDPDAPTDQLSYILGRDVALRASFRPSKDPYYLIPRCLGEMSNKLFTIGIVSATRVTKKGRFRVRAVELPSRSLVFKNHRGFSTSQVKSVAAASFQLRGADGRVHVGCGSSIG